MNEWMNEYSHNERLFILFILGNIIKTLFYKCIKDEQKCVFRIAIQYLIQYSRKIGQSKAHAFQKAKNCLENKPPINAVQTCRHNNKSVWFLRKLHFETNGSS